MRPEPDLPRRLREHAGQATRAGSVLQARLLHGAAEDYDARGPAYDLLAPLEGDPPGSVPALRLTGALHRMVLQRRAPALAVHYPSVGGTVGEVWPAARELLATQPEAVAELLGRPVQTNEVGRSGALLGGLLHLTGERDLPVVLLEVGASAGLNLHVDRFRHEVGGGVQLGEPSSPVRLNDPWQGPLPPYGLAVRIVERAGCDPAPLDPGSTEDRLTLTSYVWADQLARLERLRGAFAVAQAHPVAVEPARASAFLGRELESSRTGRWTVVWHSVVQQYLDRDEKRRLAELLAAAGSRASAESPLAHLRLEPVRVGASDFRFQVALTTWPGGRTRVLADCQGHGPPIVWR